jgi:hypothetical protein
MLRHLGIASGLLTLALWSSVVVAQDPVEEVLDNPATEVETTTPEDSAEAPATDEPADESATDTAEEPASIEPEEPAPIGDSEPTIDEVEEEAAEEADVTDEEEVMDETEEEAPVAAETDWGGIIERAPTFFAKTHHAVVHLPIALWLFGALFVVIGAVIPSWRTQIPLACLIGGAITSVAAVASGWWYAEFDYGAPWAWGDGFGDWSEHLVQHRWYGFGLAVVSIVLSIIALISQARKSKGLGFIWRMGLIGLALAVAWEGHIGGEMIHGEGFLEEAFQEWVSPAAEE